MDYLYVIVMYLLTPYVFDSSNIKYNQNVGFFVNNEIYTTTWVSSAISTGTDYDQIVNGSSYGGYYGWLYEVYSEYVVYTSDKMWFSGRWAWTPLKQGANVLIKTQDSTSSGRPVKIYYNEDPQFGVMMGYDMFRIGKLGAFAPYVGISMLRVSYATADNFQLTNNYVSTFKYHLGINLSLDDDWAFTMESSFYNMKVRDLDGLAQNLNLMPIKLKFGLSYYFNTPEILRKANRDETYRDVIRTIDVNLDNKIQEKAALENAQSNDINPQDSAKDSSASNAAVSPAKKSQSSGEKRANAKRRNATTENKVEVRGSESTEAPNADVPDIADDDTMGF